MKFIHLSPPSADFSSELQSQLRILNGNILYITREVDKINNKVDTLVNSLNLQKQVDDYFDKDSENIPEEDKDGN